MLYFSARLPGEYPADAARLFAALTAHGVPYRLLGGTKDVWLRDFMPVRTQSGKYVSFRYDPGYLRGYPELRTDFRREIAPRLHIEVTYSDIRLDGGNIAFSPSRRRAIVSDRVLAENAQIPPDALLRALEETLGAEILLIPSLKSDMTGHADGMARFVDEETVVCNRALSPCGFEGRVARALSAGGVAVRRFPFAYAAGRGAEGSYINFLQTENAIFLPVFDLPVDGDAIAAARSLFAGKVLPVPLTELAAAGGCLNCISWEL